MAYDLTGRGLYPLGNLLDVADFPLSDYVPTESLDSFFAGLYYTEASAFFDGRNLVTDIRLAFEDELALNLPGTDAIALVFFPGGVGWTSVHCQLVIGPDFSLSLLEASVSLRVSKDILEDKANGGPAEITVAADVRFSPAGVIFSNLTGASLNPAYLCGTEILVQADDVRPVFGPVDPPDFLSDQPDFHGLAITKLAVTIPSKYIETDPGADLAIELDNAMIGTTGFTGKVSISANPDHPVTGKLLGFPFRFREFELDINQNAFVDLTFGADVRLKAFEEGAAQKWVGLDLKFGRDTVSASLSVAQPPEASSTAGSLVEFKYSGVLLFDIRALRLTEAAGVCALYFSGDLKMLISGAVDWPKIAFDEIGIDSKGRFLLPDGAGINFASPMVVRWHFVRLTVSKFRFGHADAGGQKLRVALSAEVLLLEGVPSGVSVEGLIVEWVPGGAPSVRFSGIGIAFGVPGSFNARLAASYSESAGTVEFRGKGALRITALDMEVDIGVIVGEQAAVGGQPQFTFLYLFADAKLLPTGIPIAQTGLSIYGFQGLLAYNMALKLDQSLPVDERYYQMFVQPPIGITDETKWVNLHGQNALGVGVVIGTADKGFSISVKGLLVVAFPDLTILLQARANFLKLRPDLTTAEEGSLDALLVYPSGQSTLALDVVAHWGVPSVIAIDAHARAFFSFADPNAWYLEIGRDEDGKRAVAKALMWNGNWLFTAGSWFRLDSHHLVTGVLIDLGLHAERAGFSVDVRGHARGEMVLTWEPSQWEGSLDLEGSISAGFSGVSVGITLVGQARARVAQPFDVYLHVDACVHIIKKICKGFDFAWQQLDPPQVDQPLRKWAAKPRLWTAYEILAPGATARQLETGVVQLRPASASARSVQPHSSLNLDFAKPMVDVTAAFNEAVSLDDEGFLAIGQDSGCAAAYRLDSVTLFRDPAGARTPFKLWGTWARETPQPNTSLRLLSSERFDHDGSLTSGFVEGANLDYCDQPGQTIRCVSLAGMAPGYGWLPDGSIYHWTVGTEGGGPQDGGIKLGPGDAVGTILPAPVEGVTITTHPPPPTDGGPPADGGPGGVIGELCKLVGCSWLLLAVAATVAAVLLSLLAIVIPLLIGFAVLFGVIAVVLLVLYWFCRCSQGQVTGTSDHGAAQTPGEPTSGGAGARGHRRPEVTHHSSKDDSGGNGGITVSAQPDGMVAITASDLQGQAATEMCYPQGYGTPDWTRVSRRGGSKTDYEAWSVPDSMQIFPPGETFELRVSYTARLRSPDGSITDSAAVETVQFTSDGPPSRQGALRDYVASVYPFDGARPVYTGYDLSVVFREAFVPYLYASVSELLKIRLLDGQGHPVQDANGHDLLLPASSVGPVQHTVTQRVWEEIYQQNLDSGCVQGAPVKTEGTTVLDLATAAAGANLTRNSQYTAELVSDARPAIPLVSWSFTTARFATFSDLFGHHVIAQAQTGAALTGSDFDSLARAAGAPTVAYAERVTITPVLTPTADACAALLLESPEPLDFGTRLSISVNGAPAKLVANVDLTRGFALDAAGGDWPRAVLSVTVTWLRDAGAGQPRLAVKGDHSPEVVTLTLDAGAHP